VLEGLEDGRFQFSGSAPAWHCAFDWAFACTLD
jgi:hypothetical protein